MDDFKRGSFITCEGPDGVGKTTQALELVKYLREQGHDVLHTREPGGTPIGEKIRALLLNEPMTPMTELLLFAGARAQHIEEVIKPALLAGKVVVCDRFSDSSYAYQGAGRGYAREVTALEILVHSGFEPDYTLFFDAPEEVCLKRLSLRTDKLDRFDQEQLDFKHRVYMGFQERFKNKSHRMHRIDANDHPDIVAISVMKWVDEVFITFGK